MKQSTTDAKKKRKRTVRTLIRETPDEKLVYENLLSLADPITFNFGVTAGLRLPPEAPSESEYSKRLLSLRDRTLAIVGFTYLEHGLEIALRRYLSKDISIDRTNSLFDLNKNGPLAGANARIKMAMAFGVLTEEEYEDFKKIADIRNAFAHTVKHITFSEPEIQDECDSFNIFKNGELKTELAQLPKSILDTKKKFLLAVTQYFYKLHVHWP